MFPTCTVNQSMPRESKTAVCGSSAFGVRHFVCGHCACARIELADVTSAFPVNQMFPLESATRPVRAGVLDLQRILLEAPVLGSTRPAAVGECYRDEACARDRVSCGLGRPGIRACVTDVEPAAGQRDRRESRTIADAPRRAARSRPRPPWVTTLELSTQDGAFQEYALRSRTPARTALVADSSGNIWFTGNAKGYIGKLDPRTGAVAAYKNAGRQGR